jgi:hypothetical protein
MDIIREHLVYKDVPLEVCLKTLTHQEQYEFLRILLATRHNNVKICYSHENVNQYILEVLKRLGLDLCQCE